ncbi:unnamed protein product [Fraxinus pennsylvanica]|uniref:Uncharacterized protein n=1 Tax=Fraxinus pennsylvanica TaxID=56036 RepID=A0AAD2DFU2_9LAMI|nr:unnamed protein product [Fraxinus pennsylvanica]
MNQTLLYLALALFIACLVSSAEGGGDCSGGRRCNATIGERVAADGEEFQMDSEISRRILVAKTNSFGSLTAEKPYCDRDTGLRCNATIAECVADDDGEFLMESDISRRILATKPISYDGNGKQKPYCGRVVYGSCIGPESKYYEKRPCNYQNLCDRDT